MIITAPPLPDPYRWLEQSADIPEVRTWIEAQNAVTFGYLETMPEREMFRARLTGALGTIRSSPTPFQARRAVLPVPQFRASEPERALRHGETRGDEGRVAAGSEYAVR